MNLLDMSRNIVFVSSSMPEQSRWPKTKHQMYPKIIHFNAPRAEIFVSTIWEAPPSFRQALVERKVGNVSGLSTGMTMERLILALGEVDSFKALDGVGQPKNGVDEKLINLYVEINRLLQKSLARVRPGQTHFVRDASAPIIVTRAAPSAPSALFIKCQNIPRLMAKRKRF